MSAVPETLKIVQTIHDTVQVVVRDTVVRVAESQAGPRWVSIAAGLAAIMAAGVAVWGIRAWRRQLKGTTEYRLAIRVYRGVLGLRDRIQAARDGFNHFLPIYEGEERTDTQEFVERERKEYWNWMREVIKATLALKALRPEAEIHWGLDCTKHIDAMDGMARRLRGGCIAYFQHRLRAVRGETGYVEAVESDKKVVFNMKPMRENRDDYGNDLNSVVEEARTFLKAKIDLSK